MELIAAIAAQRLEQVAREARGVQPHERRDDFRRITDHEHQRLLRFVFHAVGDDRAVAVFGRQIGLGLAIDKLFAHAAISDELLDRDDRQFEFASEFGQLATIRAVACFVQYFAQHAGRQQARQPRQVDRRFGVSRAAKHAAFFGHERKQMPGPNEIGGHARSDRKSPESCGPVRQP